MIRFKGESKSDSITNLQVKNIATLLGFCCIFLFTQGALSQVQTPTFAPPQALSGSPSQIETWGVSSFDVNGDYCPDIYFGNHRLRPSLYLGNCDGTFDHRPDLIVGRTAGVDGHTTVFGDFHNDGCADAHTSVGGTNPSAELHANQLLFGELNSLGECSGVLRRQQDVDSEYPEQRGRSSVPLDVDYDGDLDLVTTGYNFLNRPVDERIFLNNGLGDLTFAPSTLAGEFGGHRLTIFNILANIDGDNELDLICGESTFPQALCSTDVSASFGVGSLLSRNLSLNLKIPAGTSRGSLLNNTVDAFAEDIDSDGDNDLVVLKRVNRAGNATRLSGNTAVESLNTTSAASPMRCLGIPGNVDIESLVITGDYVNSRDVKFGATASTENRPNDPNTSLRRYAYENISRANNTGLSLPDISDGVDENERGTYIGYVAAEQMWKVCDVTGVGPQNLEPAPRRRFNFYAFRIEFTGPVGELVHEGYNPDSEPRTPVVWINNGDTGNGTEFENKSDNGGISEAITAFGLGKGDFDNDGDMDFVASYEHYGPREDHYLYTNDGTGTFTRSRFDGCPTGIAESIAILDANGDGRLDPVIACAWFGVAHETNHAHSLWLNSSDNDNQAIMFSVVGNNANRSGIGARITVTDANDRSQTVCSRDVGNTFGRGSQDSEFVHCGVALRSTVDVIIDWPGDLGQSIYDNVSTGGMYRVEEGSSTAELIRSFGTASDPQSTPPALEITSEVVDEAAGTVSFSVNLTNNETNNTSNSITVEYSSNDNTAMSGDDYTAVSGTVTILPGEQGVTIDVSIIDDTNVEPDESFDIQLSNASGATIANTIGVITITDNDVAATLPELQVTSLTVVTESVGRVILAVILSDGAISDTDITFDYASLDNTATAGSDYNAVTGSATILAGRQIALISVTVIDDLDAEDEESFNVQLSNPSNATIRTPVGVVRITDNDLVTEPLPVIEANFNVVDEADATITMVIRLEDSVVNTTQNDITVNYTTEDITAIAGEDYVGVAGTAVIAPGRRFASINIPVLDDDIDELTERFRIQLSDAVGATINPAGGIATITDIDTTSTATPVISVNFVGVNESSNNAVLWIRLENSHPNITGSDITVDFTTVDITATAGLDYGSLSGTAVIAPDERSVQINIPIINNDVAEDTERFRIDLSNVSGAEISNDGGIITITDDD